MSIDYTYFGLDTLNNINVGDGRGAWRQWDLLDHEGPIIDLEHLGYPERHRSYLPKSLLIALYERFKEDNPSGVKLLGNLMRLIQLQLKFMVKKKLLDYSMKEKF